jgi:hypothetical protein
VIDIGVKSRFFNIEVYQGLYSCRPTYTGTHWKYGQRRHSFCLLKTRRIIPMETIGIKIKYSEWRGDRRRYASAEPNSSPSSAKSFTSALFCVQN